MSTMTVLRDRARSLTESVDRNPDLLDEVDTIAELRELVRTIADTDPDAGAVWTLSIEHRHGSDGFVFDSRRAAIDHLRNYVAEWWDEELGEDTPIPDDTEEAISVYFERVQGEYYSLVQSVVMSDVGDMADTNKN